MRTFACRLGLTVLALALAGCGRGHAGEPGTTAPAGYLALGDSYTCGQSVPADQGYPVQLAARLKRDGLDLGRPTIIAVTGWTTGDLSAALDREQPRGPFRLVTLLIGVNNQYRGLSLEAYRQEFAALLARSIALAGGRPSHVVVLSIPDWGATPFAAGRDRPRIGREIDAFNAANRAESDRAGVRYVDVTPETRGAATRPSLVAGDGLHPSAAMYAEWAAELKPVVDRAVR